MYKNILVPIIFDETKTPDAAIAAAKTLASDGASITPLHVIEELPSYASTYIADEYLERSAETVAARLTQIAAGIEGGVGVVTTGHSSRTILDYAENNGSDCIIVSSHKPGVQDYFLGGTAARVVRYAQCTVHVIR